jgi:phosphoribosylanthranilate isomerase
MKIKICGIFREQDIDYVNEARPDYCGFVFAESKRQVSPAQAANLRRRLAENIAPVGVFVNAPIENIAALYRDGAINIAQLHGNETEEYIAHLKEATGDTPIPVIKVIKSTSFNTLSRRHGEHGEYKKNIKTPCPPSCPQDSSPPCLRENYYLIDSGSGSGETFDWSLLSSLNIDKPWFLAGGINLDNIKRAMAINPFGIDVSSGAETDGVKDREKILQLTAAVRKGKTV